MKSITLLTVLGSSVSAIADPQLTSWFTEDSGQYARIYQSAAAETASTVSKTWSRGSGVQSSPTYAGISKIVYSSNWVYIRATGLAGRIMGPWYLDAAKTTHFGNFPSNTAKIYRIPRSPVIPVTKTLTGLGASGCMANGVSLFDMRDAFSYVSASSTDATPVNGLTGDGVWNRDGYHNEGVTFDPALAHPRLGRRRSAGLRALRLFDPDESKQQCAPDDFRLRPQKWQLRHHQSDEHQPHLTPALGGAHSNGHF